MRLINCGLVHAFMLRLQLASAVLAVSMVKEIRMLKTRVEKNRNHGLSLFMVVSHLCEDAGVGLRYPL